MAPESSRAGAVGPGEGEFVLALIFQLARGARTDLEREVASAGITSQQAGLLLRAWWHGGVSPGLLAAPLGTDTAGMTRLVDRLEAKGLVVRESSRSDRRSVVIQLTDAGRALVPRLAPAFQRVNARLLEGLAEEDVRRLTSLLRRLGKNLVNLEELSGSHALAHSWSTAEKAGEREC